MKPKSPSRTAQKPKLPKARRAWIVENGHVATMEPKKFGYVGNVVECVLLPQSSAKSARARLKRERLDDEQKVEAVAKLMREAYDRGCGEDIPAAIVSLLR